MIDPHYRDTDDFTHHEESANKTSCIMSSVAPEVLCEVWENNPDQVPLMSSGSSQKQQKRVGASIELHLKLQWSVDNWLVSWSFIKQ